LYQAAEGEEGKEGEVEILKSQLAPQLILQNTHKTQINLNKQKLGEP